MSLLLFQEFCLELCRESTTGDQGTETQTEKTVMATAHQQKMTEKVMNPKVRAPRSAMITAIAASMSILQTWKNASQEILPKTKDFNATIEHLHYHRDCTHDSIFISASNLYALTPRIRCFPILLLFMTRIIGPFQPLQVDAKYFVNSTTAFHPRLRTPH